MGVHVGPLDDVAVHRPTHRLAFLGGPAVFAVPEGLAFVYALFVKHVSVDY